MTKGTGCIIYESQATERFCRTCTDDICIARWQKVTATFPLNQLIELSDQSGTIYVTRVISAKRPIHVQWHQPEPNAWARSTFLLYWKSLDQHRPYHDPDNHMQAKFVAALVGIAASL